MSDKEVYRNDDIGAFGGSITINLDNPGEYIITRADFQCGCFFRSVENPVFPLVFKPTREDTAKFTIPTLCYLRVYDSNGLRQTCKGYLSIPVKNEVIKNNGLCC